MPYIESNQDVSQNDLFNKALLVGAVAIGAAAAGQMAFKSIAEKWGSSFGHITEGKQVLKGLYGKEAGNLQKGIVDDVPLPNWTKDGPQYSLITNGNKAPRLQRTDGSAWQRFKSNKLSPTWLAGKDSKFLKPADRNLAAFNKQLKDIHGGKFEGYSKSKLNMYEDIVNTAEANNINITGRDAVNATNHMYKSDANYYNRKNNNINNLADDVALTNSIWGEGNKTVPIPKVVTPNVSHSPSMEQTMRTYDTMFNNVKGADGLNYNPVMNGETYKHNAVLSQFMDNPESNFIKEFQNNSSGPKSVFGTEIPQNKNIFNSPESARPSRSDREDTQKIADLYRQSNAPSDRELQMETFLGNGRAQREQFNNTILQTNELMNSTAPTVQAPQYGPRR